MKTGCEFDIIVYGATGFTGKLVAEHLVAHHPGLSWAMAGRSAEKLAEVAAELGTPASVALIVADSNDRASLEAMCAHTRIVITTAGPYQNYGSTLVAVCAATGTDYLDLSGEPLWMAEMIPAHHAEAIASGARILFSCGFDSSPFELGVIHAPALAVQHLGAPVPVVHGRVRAMSGGLSGGTAASGAATMAAIGANPALMGVMFNPFALTPGFTGPEQPRGDKPRHDDLLGEDVGPFMMAAINTKNVHRSNFLAGHPWGEGFRYDEMAVVKAGVAAEFPGLSGPGVPKPGEGPGKAAREAGFYDLLFIGVAEDGRQVRAAVYGDRDPGYGSTSKIIAETALCLLEAKDLAGGIWVPGAALGQPLIDRLQARAGLSFTDETA